MLRDPLAGVHDEPSRDDPISSFHSTGLPDDFDQFMADVARFDTELSEAELNELAAREDDRRMSEDIKAAVETTRRITEAIGEVFPTLRRAV